MPVIIRDRLAAEVTALGDGLALARLGLCDLPQPRRRKGRQGDLHRAVPVVQERDRRELEGGAVERPPARRTS